MNKLPLTILMIAAIGLMIPASASTCTPSTAKPEIATPSGMYIDNDVCDPDCMMVSAWIYQESNGIPGLQRADAVVDNTCNGKIFGDTRVF